MNNSRRIPIKVIITFNQKKFLSNRFFSESKKKKTKLSRKILYFVGICSGIGAVPIYEYQKHEELREMLDDAYPNLKYTLYPLLKIKDRKTNEYYIKVSILYYLE